MDIKRLSIEVSSKGIKTAADQLDKFVGVASKADSSIAKAKQALSEFSHVELGSINLQLKSSSEGLRYLKNSTKDFSNMGQGFKGLSTAVTNTATAIEKMVASTSGMVSFNAQLQVMKEHLSEIKASGLTALRLPSTSTVVSAGGRPVSSDDSKLATQQKRIISQIERDQVILEKGKVGWYEYRAAQLGVSQQAAPYIDKMKAATAQTGNFTISARQAAAAARMLPAQFTDIATQLAGGQNPLLIMLQQGGQIKDMYQGDLKRAFKDMGGYIGRFVTNPFLLAAAAIAGVGAAFYMGRSETDAYGKSLALTNGYVGQTKNSLIDMSRAIGDGAVTQGKAADVLNQMVAAGVNAGGAFQIVGKSIAEFSQKTGADTKNLVQEFAALGKDPVAALLALDKQYHGLSASTLAQVSALQQSGKTYEAAQVAMAAHAQMLEKIGEKYAMNKGLAERFFDGVVMGAKRALDAVLGFGREMSTMEKLADKNAGIGKSLSFMQFLPGGAAVTKFYEPVLATEKLIAAEKTRLVGMTMMEAKAKEAAEAQKKRDADGVSALTYIDSVRDKSLTKRQRQQKELLENEKQVDKIKSARLSKEQEAAALETLAADRRRILSESVGPSNVKQESRLIAEIAAMKQEIAVLNELGPNYQKVTEARKAFMAAEIALKDKGLKESDRKNLLEELPLLREKAALSEQKVAAEEKYKNITDAQDLYKTLQANITAQRTELETAKESGATKIKVTESEKKYVEWLNKTAEATDLVTKLEYAKIAASYFTISQNEQMIASQERLAKAKDAYAKRESAALIEQQSLKDRLYSGEIKDTGKAAREVEERGLLAISNLRATANEQRANGAKEAADQTEKQIDLEYKLINSSKQLINTYAENKFVLTDFYATAGSAAKTWLENQQSAAQAMGEMYTKMFDTATDALVNFAMTGKMNTKEMVKSMLSDISRLLIKMAVLQAAQKMAGLFSGGSTSVSGMSSINAGNSADYGAYAQSAGYAKGGVFTNSVVSRPTFFANGGSFNKLGVMGEAGPEAVMPLSRTSGGELGVKVAGGAGGTSISVVVHIDNEGNASVASSAEEGRALGDAIAAVVEKKVTDMQRAGGRLDPNRRS